MVAELAPLKAKILAVSYHKKRTEEKAEEFAVSAREKKFDKDLSSLPARSGTKR